MQNCPFCWFICKVIYYLSSSQISHQRDYYLAEFGEVHSYATCQEDTPSWEDTLNMKDLNVPEMQCADIQDFDDYGKVTTPTSKSSYILSYLNIDVSLPHGYS